jgi:hypothetical protein
VSRDHALEGSLTPKIVRAQLRTLLDDWQALLAGDVSGARRLLEGVLADRIVFRPVVGKASIRYQLKVSIAFDRMLTAAVPAWLRLQDRGASPTGSDGEWKSLDGWLAA